MGANLERLQALLGDLRKADPDAGARGRLIPSESGPPDTGARAVELIALVILLDPYALVPGDPPQWLIDAAAEHYAGTTGRPDPRVRALAERTVADLLVQDLTAEQLVDWLEPRALGAPALSSPSGG